MAARSHVATCTPPQEPNHKQLQSTGTATTSQPLTLNHLCAMSSFTVARSEGSFVSIILSRVEGAIAHEDSNQCPWAVMQREGKAWRPST